MKHRVAHDLDDDTARQACDAAIDAYRSRFPEFNPEASWKDDKAAWQKAYNAGNKAKSKKIFDDMKNSYREIPEALNLLSPRITMA